MSTIYNSLKEAHPNFFVLYKCGMFYHVFHDDAATVAEIINESSDNTTGITMKVDTNPHPCVARTTRVHEEFQIILSQHRPIITYESKLSDEMTARHRLWRERIHTNTL